MSPQWIMKKFWLVKEQSPSTDVANGDDSRLYQLEARVREIVKHLRTLTNTVSDLIKMEGANEEESSKHAKIKTNFVQKRHFSNLGKPLSKVFEELREQGLLQPLESKPIPNPLPNKLDSTLYCIFHQFPGDETDRCARLRHEIQNLIDAGIIPNPEGNSF